MANAICGSIDFLVHEQQSRIYEQELTLKDHVEIQNAIRQDLIKEKASHNSTIDELNACRDEIDKLRSALFMALPFVEDCQGRVEYKRGTVSKCVRVIKEALSI